MFSNIRANSDLRNLARTMLKVVVSWVWVVVQLRLWGVEQFTKVCLYGRVVVWQKSNGEGTPEE